MDMRHRGGFLFRCVGDDEEYATGNKVEERTAACPRGNWSRIAADIDATATDEDGSDVDDSEPSEDDVSLSGSGSGSGAGSDAEDENDG
jgi:hypothetical protein